MSYKRITIKKGRDIPLRNRHHWIFSGAIEHAPDYSNGEIMTVHSHDGDLLGHAYFNQLTDIAGRMINFDKTPPLDTLRNSILNAIRMRDNLFDEKTNCFRVINGEGDGIPGLVVDKYGQVLVLQVATLGMELLKDFVVEVISSAYGERISCIYERSNMSSRKREGLKSYEGLIYGECHSPLEVLENSIRFTVDFIHGQKTGLFLDMREMRKLVQHISFNKRVLNCFCYTGGFSMYALKGGAKKVDSIDVSREAIELAGANFMLNGYDTANNRLICGDVFDFLREQPIDYDMVILDPPAFAKKRNDVDNAKKGYLEINKTTLAKMPPQSILLTCSCSYHVDELTFDRIIARAAKEAKREIKIISRHRLAKDHPINIYHTEFDYLKSLLIYVV